MSEPNQPLSFAGKTHTPDWIDSDLAALALAGSQNRPAALSNDEEPETDQESTCSLQSREVGRLIDEARNGSPEALKELVGTYYGFILQYIRFCRWRAGMPRDPPRRNGWNSSLAFDSLEHALRNFDQFRGKSAAEFWQWLIAVCRNEESDRWRMRRAQKRDAAREVSWECALSADARDLAAIDDAPSPHERATQDERDEAVHAALETLDEVTREAIRLHFWEGWSYERIGKALGKAGTAIESLIRRGRAKLKKRLRRDFE